MQILNKSKQTNKKSPQFDPTKRYFNGINRNALRQLKCARADFGVSCTNELLTYKATLCIVSRSQSKAD